MKDNNKTNTSKDDEQEETSTGKLEGVRSLQNEHQQQSISPELKKSLLEIPRATVVAPGKATFRGLLAPQPRQDDEEQETIAAISRKARKTQKRYKVQGVLKEDIDDSVIDATSIFPGAVSVPGPQIQQLDNQNIETSVTSFRRDEPAAEENAVLNGDRAVQAHVVPDAQDIEEILKRRLSDELHQRLQEERQNAVIAEVVGSDHSDRNRNATSRKCLSILIIVIVAIALGVSLGIRRSNPSSSKTSKPAEKAPTYSPRASLTPSPTTWSRVRFIEDVLNSEWNTTGGNMSKPWTVPGSPQYDAFDWLTSNDTYHVETLTASQLLERYVLAVLYFNAEQPENGSHALPYFLQPVSVCQWNMREDNLGVLTGVSACLQGESVSEIRLGTFFSKSEIIRISRLGWSFSYSIPRQNCCKIFIFQGM